jgi:hypothetical protein
MIAIAQTPTPGRGFKGIARPGFNIIRSFTENAIASCNTNITYTQEVKNRIVLRTYCVTSFNADEKPGLFGIF